MLILFDCLLTVDPIEHILSFRPKITKFNFKRKKLILVVVEDNEGADQPEVKQEHTFVFRYNLDWVLFLPQCNDLL